ncbi:MAG TPA: hypothetical protein VFG51_01105 [Candidatus Saccharimonadia bacterium]|nr:hypothetical protein [Candidatus Saccharimonadia bacterium]
MDTTILPVSFQDSVMLALTGFLTQLSVFLPRLIAALLVLILGAAIARWLKAITVRVLESLRLSRGLKDTPIESFLMHAEAGKIEEVIGTIVYWIAMLIVVHATVSLLGLEAVSNLLAQVLGYIPNVISAVLILFFGVLLAGVVETLVKGALMSVSGKSARLFGKVSSYMIVVISVMAAIAQLNIAQQFITMLFTGLVATLAIAFGLAFGLGSKSVVEKMMQEWYEKMRKDLQ